MLEEPLGYLRIERATRTAPNHRARGRQPTDTDVNLGLVRDREDAGRHRDRVAADAAWATVAVPSFVGVAEPRRDGRWQPEPLRAADHHLAVGPLELLAKPLAAYGHRRDRPRAPERTSSQRGGLAETLCRIAEVDRCHRAAHGVVVGEDPRGFVGVPAAADEPKESDVIDGRKRLSPDAELRGQPDGEERVAQPLLDREVVADVAGEGQRREDLIQTHVPGRARHAASVQQGSARAEACRMNISDSLAKQKEVGKSALVKVRPTRAVKRLPAASGGRYPSVRSASIASIRRLRRAGPRAASAATTVITGRDGEQKGGGDIRG